MAKRHQSGVANRSATSGRPSGACCPKVRSAKLGRSEFRRQAIAGASERSTRLCLQAEQPPRADGSSSK